MSSKQAEHGARSWPLVIATLGVVYGDIGTSPLYTMKQMFFGEYPLSRTPDHIMGGLSLIFWTLTLVISLKYVVLILMADHGGEGGVFALLGLYREQRRNQGKNGRLLSILTVFILFGAALLYGDGIITPAISVLSAFEGLGVATQLLEPAIVPMTVLTLVVLFLFQKHGTSKVGKAFGPIMIGWFVIIALLGLRWVVKYPQVLLAVNPIYAVEFLRERGFGSLHLLGAVVLCITGGEALYADMGHFGRKSIRTSWFSLVYPSLLLNYFGQGARLLEPGDIPNGHIFFSLVSQDAFILYPMVLLSALATVIASQALISGAFSLTRQGIALGYFPRLNIVYTSAEVEGQVYVPAVNRLLLLGCTLLVLSFKTSDALGAAYGIAVTGTMGITTMAFYVVARGWGWNPRWLIPLCGLFLTIDLSFFLSNCLKFFNGGFVPIVLAAGLFSLMRVWRWGRELLVTAYIKYRSPRLHKFVDLKQKLLESPTMRIQYGRRTLAQVDRAIVFLSSVPVTSADEPTPIGLQIYLRRNGALPKYAIILNVSHLTKPYIWEAERVTVTDLGANIIAVNAVYGYMQNGDVPNLLFLLKERGLIHIDENRWTVQVGEEEIILDKDLSPFKRLALKYFQSILRFSSSADRYFGLQQYPGRAKTIIPLIISENDATIVVQDDDIE